MKDSKKSEGKAVTHSMKSVPKKLCMQAQRIQLSSPSLLESWKIQNINAIYYQKNVKGEILKHGRANEKLGGSYDSRRSQQVGKLEASEFPTQVWA